MDNWKNKLIDELKLRGYSKKTIKAYTFHINNFIKSNLEPKQYLLNEINKGKSKSSIRVIGFAIKFYLKYIKNKKENFNFKNINIPNIKKNKSLPEVLSNKEIEGMINATKNLTHRLIIQILYSAGLRASEVINLKWNDLNFNRNIIHIKLAKGNKDRVVMLSPKIKKLLNKFDDEKEGLIFKSNRNKKYSLTTIQKIVSDAAKKSGIKKKVTPHCLRHSFATHLLEKGIDIRYIKELLGHARVETTMIYTKVSNKELLKIKSPY